MEPVVTVLLFVAVVFLLVILWAAYQYVNFTKWSICLSKLRALLETAVLKIIFSTNAV